jgi:hypothetical protein
MSFTAKYDHNGSCVRTMVMFWWSELEIKIGRIRGLCGRGFHYPCRFDDVHAPRCRSLAPYAGIVSLSSRYLHCCRDIRS